MCDIQTIQNVNMSLDITGFDMTQGYVAMIDKPLGWTSTDVVRKIKYALKNCGYKKIKIGHAGTLDPLATGLLLICIGKATKLVDALQNQEKEYIAEVTLGATTPSYDREQPIDKTFPTEHITVESIEEALNKLLGERLQTPPIFSAKRIEGVRAYEAARAGEQIEMRKALINIFELENVACDLKKNDLKVRVKCSKGTYIRSLAFEIGELLNSGAHLKSLRRTKSGEKNIDENGWLVENFIKKLYIAHNVDPEKFEQKSEREIQRKIEAV